MTFVQGKGGSIALQTRHAVGHARGMTTTRIATQPAAETPKAARTGSGGLRPLVIDVGIPLASYSLLRKAGCDTVTALALSSVLPAVRAVRELIASRTL